MGVVDPRPLLAPLISFACAGLVFAAGRNAFWRRFWSLSAAAVKLALVLSMLPGTLRGVVYTFDVVAFTPGIGIAFRADAYGMFFALVSSTLWTLTTIYAIGYMRGEPDRSRFFGFFALCVSTTVGVAFAENLLTFFLFYETLTICTYPLVVHAETPEALRAGRVYLTYTLIGGGFVLLGSVMAFDAAGTLTLAQPGILPADAGGATLATIFAALIVGFGVKAAIMPLHGWLPLAMVAPTPVSALLHAVAVVKVGAFGVTRVIYNVFGVELLQDLGFATPLAWLAAFTILAGSAIALTQDHLKRRLAYSTISQLSYIVLGAALLTPFAATAAILHVAHQAFAKITMFFVVGAIQRTTGKTRVSELAGIGARMPWSMAAFTIAALSFVGVPLFAGFVTKWYLSLGALQAGAGVFVGVMLVSSLLNAAYWFPIVHLAYFRRADGGDEGVHEAPPLLLVPILICAAYVLLLGLTTQVPGMPFSVAQVAVERAFAVPAVVP
ncbi:MAG: monovalent cation/H+ antiporter subunit D family protein [Trueperaceae bacterium]|nr:monovalent cation/H+ antiporter subunit D family protein [Trueperaceae bacterium]